MQTVSRSCRRLLGIGLTIAIAACGADYTSPTATRLPASDRVAAVYQNNPAQVTPDDAALILAFANLPAASRDSGTLSQAARALLRSNEALAIIAPALTATNTDLALPVDTIDTVDVAVALAALHSEAPTKSSLAIAASRLLPIEKSLQARDIRIIPGTGLPGDPGLASGLARIVSDDLDLGSDVTSAVNNLPDRRISGSDLLFPPGTSLLFPTPPDPDQALRVSYEPPLSPARNDIAALPPISAAALGCDGSQCIIPENLSLLPDDFRPAPGEYTVRYTFTGRNAANAAVTTVVERSLTVLPFPTSSVSELFQGNAGTSSLLETDDGTLLGTISTGGTDNAGGLFRFDPRIAQVTFLRSFGGGLDGQQPLSGLTLAADGNFYGTTAAGGALSSGTIYRLTPAGQFSVVHSFDDSLGEGSFPVAELLAATNGKLYGTSTVGGNGAGAAFQFDPTTQQFAPLEQFSFSGQGEQGVRSPLIQASDNLLYGVSASGLFSLTLDGTFTPIASGGSFDAGARLVERDRSLYITVPLDDGRIVKYDLDTQTFVPIHVFSGSDGSSPSSGLTLAPDGNLYGTTSGGGDQNLGTIFRIEADDTFLSLYSFSNRGDSAQPFGQLTLTRDGSFYTSSRPLINRFGIVRFTVEP